VRGVGGIEHIVAVLGRGRFHDLQWGIGCLPAARIIWGEQAGPCDVGYSVVTGTPGGIRRPAPGQTWTVDSEITGEGVELLVRAVSEEVRVMIDFLSRFAGRRDVWTYILGTRDSTEPSAFTIPGTWPLRILTAAALAAVDGDPEARELIPEAEAAWAKFTDEMNRQRLKRLAEAARSAGRS